MNFSFLKSGTFWSIVVLCAYNLFSTLVPLFPNVSWLTFVVNALASVSALYFHKTAVVSALAAPAQTN
jgi:hypothetical protein